MKSDRKDWKTAHTLFPHRDFKGMSIEQIYNNINFIITEPDVLCISVGNKKLGIPYTENNKKYHLYAAALDAINKMPKNEQEENRIFLNKEAKVSKTNPNNCVNKNSLLDELVKPINSKVDRKKYF